MEILEGLSPLVVGAVLVGVLFILLIIGTYINAQNDWHLTSMNQNTARAIVSGRGNCVRILWNSDETYLDKNYDAQPLYDANGELTEAAKKAHPNFLARWIHEEFNIWWVSPIYPIKRVYKFPITKARLIEEEIAGKDIASRIDRDEKPVMVSELLINFPRPITVMEAETKDNFKVNVLVVVVVRVTNPHTVIFKFGGVKMFSLLTSAVSSAVNNYVRELSHDDFIKVERGKDSKIVSAIHELNGTPDKMGGSTELSLFEDITESSVAGNVRSRGIKKVLGIEVVDIWIEAIDPDDDATKPVKAVQEATFAAKKKGIEADAEQNYLTKVAAGKVAETRMLVEIYGDPSLARDERVATLHGPNISTLVNGATSTGVMVGTPPTTPATTPPATKPEKKPSDTPPAEGAGSTPST